METRSRSHRRTKSLARVSEAALASESLENRQLLSATASLVGGEIQIRGTNANDVTEVTSEKGIVRVNTFNGTEHVTASFARGRVTGIAFWGYRGNDNFTNATNIPLRAYGHDGDDVLVGGSGNDVLYGGRGLDTITGSEGNDWVDGQDGNDFLMGGTGNDTVIGGNGNDQLFGEEGHDRLYGGWGNDRLMGDEGNDRLYGYAGIDELFGGNGADFLYGESGNDTLYGGTGNDVVRGGSGHDTLAGESGNDWLHGESGNDRIYGGIGADVLIGGDGNDTLSGNSGNDRMWGQNGCDRMYGGSGNDRMYGGFHNDVLYGGTGADVVNGEAGYDYQNSFSAVSGPAAPASESGLTLRQVSRVIDAVLERWEAAGLDTDKLGNIEFRIADLPPTKLGFTVGRSDGSAVVWIDSNANGQGWYVDQSPLSDTEFRVVNGIMTARSGAARNRVDLFSVIGHEVGHVAGLTHTAVPSVMTPILAKGTRFSPTRMLAQGAAGHTEGPFLDSLTYSEVQQQIAIGRLIQNFASRFPAANRDAYQLGALSVMTPYFLNQGIGGFLGSQAGLQLQQAINRRNYQIGMQNFASSYSHLPFARNFLLGNATLPTSMSAASSSGLSSLLGQFGLPG